MRDISIRAGIVAGLMLAGGAAQAQTPKEYRTLNMSELQSIVERGGLDLVAIERGSMMVSDGQGSPARLSLAGCDVDGACRVVRIYTRYVIGESQQGVAALNDFSRNFTSATLIRVVVAEEPAVDVGRDASLERGRTAGEIMGEIAAAMSDAWLLREKLMDSDPFLKATLGGRN
jgi:hypothetical protein